MSIFKSLLTKDEQKIADDSLYRAVRDNEDIKLIQTFLAVGANANASFKDGVTLLHLAALMGNKTIIKTLIDAGAKVDRAKDNGATPIFMAAQNGHTETVKVLVDAGAKVDKAKDNGVTPLYMAAQNGHIETVKVLVAAGAKVDVINVNGVTPLYIAVESGHIETVKALVASGAKVDKAKGDGITPLHIAAQNGHIEAAKFLLKAGAKVDAVNLEGNTPLLAAAMKGEVNIIHLLLAAGAQINSMNIEGTTPLLIASYKGHVTAVKALIYYNANIDASMKRGETSLYFASQFGHVEIVKTLLNHGANIEAALASGSTPLHCAIENCKVEIVKLLVSAGSKLVNLPVSVDSGINFLLSIGKIADKICQKERLTAEDQTFIFINDKSQDLTSTLAERVNNYIWKVINSTSEEDLKQYLNLPENYVKQIKAKFIEKYIKNYKKTGEMLSAAKLYAILGADGVEKANKEIEKTHIEYLDIIVEILEEIYDLYHTPSIALEIEEKGTELNAIISRIKEEEDDPSLLDSLERINKEEKGAEIYAILELFKYINLRNSPEDKAEVIVSVFNAATFNIERPREFLLKLVKSKEVFDFLKPPVSTETTNMISYVKTLASYFKIIEDNKEVYSPRQTQVYQIIKSLEQKQLLPYEYVEKLLTMHLADFYGFKATSDISVIEDTPLDTYSNGRVEEVHRNIEAHREVVIGGIVTEVSA